MIGEEKLIPAARSHADKSSFQSGWYLASIAALTFLICCLRLFVLPHTPLLLWGDAPGYAIKGVRLLGGEVPYRDFFEFVTPGTDLFYAFLFRLFGVSLWAMHLAMALLAAAVAALMTWCTRRLVQGWIQFLPAALLIGFVLGYSLDLTHHWFSTLALLCAIAILLDGSSLPRVAWAGAFCGLAATFTQTKGAAAVLALLVYSIWISRRENDGTGKWWRRCLLLILFALAVFLAINGPFIIAAGVRKWAWDVIVFPVHYFGSVQANTWTGAFSQFIGSPGSLKWVVFPFQYLVVPLTYIWFFLHLKQAKEEDSEPWNQLMLVALVGLAMFAAVAPGMSIRRVSAANPPAVLLLTYLLSKRRRVRTALVLGGFSILIALAAIASIQLKPRRFLTLPIGQVAVPPRADYYDIYRWMAENTESGQWYFGLPPLTLALELKNPTPMGEMSLGEYTRPEQVTEIVEGIERVGVRIIVLRPAMYRPTSGDLLPDHLQPFRDNLYLHYRREHVFQSGDEVWRRIDR
jgi:hypothetical protein